ncbi:MAG: hypothetical protein A2087_04215 [Spirochaetes bacterium GWD1_61_31]|nr:MAG: hypothetical protein A2Y37_10780 [Spirochaetes bacterium GWB1_60_80]OHD34095.1 MAG: hypothetical protein A2004_05135 [Spirochaetes bacterium GWC1_61_12]OHD35415.1 MAG: hypothetical protein A2087_04215 [Spirochaetes bacterium GWD1_61_31]OHD44923.1 MAG: hypothetical protein A2Y35_12820 [Spirochaetes bacterium GWE1_60_18]OHD60034.1 MAG: hypothetical protein A2Y32_10930 [Spirochaetes bacterium GWF1_60_12]HAP43718.1 hypothetical protein [Spirochaetaceae bacterium]
MNRLLALKEDFTRQGILISFNGSFSHSIIEEVGTAAKRYMETRDLNKNTITDVFAVYIEQTQNVRNYVLERGLAKSAYDSAIVLITATEGLYAVSAGNPVLKRDRPALELRLTALSRLDKADLKQLYRQQLRAPPVAEARGAGLGLIDMARRAAGPLTWSFENLDATHDFFSLVVHVTGA